MITIVAKSIIKNGMKENFRQTARELIVKSREEEGCISYNLYEDIDNEDILVFIEEWKDQNVIQLHNESKHFNDIIPRLAKLRKGNPEIKCYRKI